MSEGVSPRPGTEWRWAAPAAHRQLTGIPAGAWIGQALGPDRAGDVTSARSGAGATGAAAPVDERGAHLVARGIRKTFGGVVALDAADFEAKPGEITGLIGPNGSGKTTLINALTGMITPEEGEATLDGELLPFGAPATIAGRRVARTFQHIRLLPELTVRENVVIGGIAESLRRPLGTVRLWLGAIGSRRELVRRANEALDIAGVGEDVRSSGPATLSYGVQRRVEIARAICGRPTLLLLDEPAAGMNTAETTALGDMVRALAKDEGISVVIVDHNLDLILGYVDSLTAFDRGRRIAFGDPEVVRRDPGVIESYLGPSFEDKPA